MNVEYELKKPHEIGVRNSKTRLGGLEEDENIMIKNTPEPNWRLYYQEIWIFEIVNFPVRETCCRVGPIGL